VLHRDLYGLAGPAPGEPHHTQPMPFAATRRHHLEVRRESIRHDGVLSSAGRREHRDIFEQLVNKQPQGVPGFLNQFLRERERGREHPMPTVVRIALDKLATHWTASLAKVKRWQVVPARGALIVRPGVGVGAVDSADRFG